MPQETENDHDPGSEKPSAEPDPFEIKNHIRGLLMLLVVAALLWGLSKFGPRGADWLGNQTKALFALKADEETIGVIETRQESPGVSNQNNDSSGGDSKIAHAKKTIIETLGGADHVTVQHIAISGDEKTMVAAVKLIDPDGSDRLEEIFFEQDDFGRYISTKDSPVTTVIKIWKQE